MAKSSDQSNLNITKKELGSSYSATTGAANALKTLTNATNALKLYDTSKVNDYYNNMRKSLGADGYTWDRGTIQGLLDEATKTAYDAQYKELMQAANAAEDQQVANTRNSVAEMRKGLAGSASSGANVGAANATALQAMLGLGQQNSALSTQALQNAQNTAREKSAALAQNAMDALTTSNDALNNVLSQANSAYGSDQAAGGERGAYAAQGLGTLASAMDTNKSNEKQNKATNKTNVRIAQQTTRNKNWNYD